MSTLHVLAGISLGPADPRVPHPRHRRRGAAGVDLPPAGHQRRRPARLPGRGHRVLGLAVHHGLGVVALRLGRHARHAARVGGQGGRLPDDPAGLRSPRAPATSTPPSCPPHRGAQQARGPGPASTSRTQPSPSSTAGRSSPEANPSFGEAKAAVDEYFAANPARGPRHRQLRRLRRRCTRSSAAARTAHGQPEPASTGSRRSSRPPSASSSTRPTTRSSQVQPVAPQVAGPGSRRPSPRRTPPSRWSRVIMERDLGQCRSPGFMLTVSSGIMFGLLATRPPPPRQAGHRGAGHAARHPGGLTDVGQYLPVVALLVLAVLFGALSRVASQLLGPAAPDRRPRRRRTSAASCPSASRPSASRCGSTWSR